MDPRSVSSPPKPAGTLNVALSLSLCHCHTHTQDGNHVDGRGSRDHLRSFLESSGGSTSRGPRLSHRPAQGRGRLPHDPRLLRRRKDVRKTGANLLKPLLSMDCEESHRCSRTGSASSQSTATRPNTSPRTKPRNCLSLVLHVRDTPLLCVYCDVIGNRRVVGDGAVVVRGEGSDPILRRHQ